MRKVLPIVVILLCILFVTTDSLASDSPSQRLKNTVDQVLVHLKDPAYQNPATRPPIRADIEKQIRVIFDFNEFSARTVGKNWSAFSSDQQKRFNDAFADLLLVTYLDKIDGYNGEQIAYTGEILSGQGNRTEVQTIVTLSDGKKTPVAYRMMLKNNQWVVYDVIIENISLIKNYRSQFKDILTKGTPDQLIAKVLHRTKELRDQNAKK